MSQLSYVELQRDDTGIWYNGEIVDVILDSKKTNKISGFDVRIEKSG